MFKDVYTKINKINNSIKIINKKIKYIKNGCGGQKTRRIFVDTPVDFQIVQEGGGLLTNLFGRMATAARHLAFGKGLLK